MLCDMCGKAEATVHLTEIVDHKVVELHLCEACAQEKAAQMQIPTAFPMFLGGIAPDKSKAKDSEPLTCPNCGLTYKEFRKIGRLGCSQCYNAFKQNLRPLLRNIHGSANHVGKRPKRVSEEMSKELELAELRQALKDAIAKEEFEEAAKLRDKIRQIEAGA